MNNVHVAEYSGLPTAPGLQLRGQPHSTSKNCEDTASQKMPYNARTVHQHLLYRTGSRVGARRAHSTRGSTSHQMGGSIRPWLLARGRVDPSPQIVASRTA